MIPAQSVPRTAAPILVLSLLAGCSASQSDHQPRASSSPVLSSTEDFKTPPITAQTHYAAGQLAESGNPQTAIEQYEQALKLDPHHLPSLYRLGVLYARLKQFPKALQTWRRYVAACNGSADAYANLGFCLELAGRPHDAEAAYHKGLDADPKNQPCLINLGLLLARTGRDGEALTTLQRTLSPAEARYDLASVYEAKGEREQAKLEYRKALQLDPHFADAQQRLASIPTEP